MIVQKIMAAVVCVALALGMAGCSSEPDAPAPDATPSIQYATTDPQSLQNVLDRIYEDLKIEGLSDAGDDALRTVFHIDTDLVVDYAVRYTNGRYGVCDVAIIRPVEGHAEEIVDALELRRDDRIAEFENYDVFDSLDIAKNAEIFTRGDYVISLMLSDTDSARTIVLEEIPG